MQESTLKMLLWHVYPPVSSSPLKNPRALGHALHLERRLQHQLGEILAFPEILEAFDLQEKTNKYIYIYIYIHTCIYIFMICIYIYIICIHIMMITTIWIYLRHCIMYMHMYNAHVITFTIWSHVITWAYNGDETLDQPVVPKNAPAPNVEMATNHPKHTSNKVRRYTVTRIHRQI